jgi:hypothetical protein
VNLATEQRFVTIKNAEIRDFLVANFVPQAVVTMSLRQLADQMHTTVFKGHDDLDTYEGIGFFWDGQPVAIMRYRGYPRNTSTIYLPKANRDVREITMIIQGILTDLKIKRKAIKWQRSQNPDL